MTRKSKSRPDRRVCKGEGCNSLLLPEERKYCRDCSDAARSERITGRKKGLTAQERRCENGKCRRILPSDQPKGKSECIVCWYHGPPGTPDRPKSVDEHAEIVSRLEGEFDGADAARKYLRAKAVMAQIPRKSKGGRPRKGYSYKWKAEAALEDALKREGIEIRYNIRKARIEFRSGKGRWRNWEDRQHERLIRTLAEKYTYRSPGMDRVKPLRYTKVELYQFLGALSADCEIEELMTRLDGLPEWDGTQRVDGLLDHLFGCSSPLASWCSRHMLVGALFRTYHPGCKLDEMPVLIGPQGGGKSTLLAGLIWPEHRKDWFSDGLTFTGSKQRQVEATLGRVIVEVSEMAGSTKAEIDSIKSYLSRGDDGSRRLSYRRDPVPLERRFVIVGTTNEWRAIPNDPTGNRRFVPVVVQRKNYHVMAYLDEHRDQLWAEALVIFKRMKAAGEGPGLPRELWKAQRQANRRHQNINAPLVEALRDVYSGDNAPEDGLPMWEILQRLDRSYGIRTHQKALAAALAHIGVKLVRKKVGGRNVRLWTLQRREMAV